MKNKYYTPKLKEFRIGFEYQGYDMLDNGKWGWVDHIFEGEEIRTYFTEELKKGEVRVKYLDKEDIESLGFTVAKNDPYWYDYKNSRFYLYKDNPISKYWTISDEESQFGFTGSIKNISELKVLLKQLNIHD